MNKIYKVIWSKAKHCYVVVSELAKNHTKGCGRRSLRRTAVSLGIVATLLGGFSGSAWATAWKTSGDTTIEADEIDFITAGNNNIAIHVEAVYSGPSSTKTITISATDTNTTYTAGNGITITGDANAIAVKAGTNVTVDANGVSVVGTNTISSGGTNLATSGGVYTALTAGTFALSGSTLNAAGNATVGGTLGVAGSSALDGGITVATNKFTVDTNGNATVGSLKIGTTSYGITSEGAATVSLLTIGSTNVGETLAAKADAADVSALNTKTQYVASAGENKTTITGTLEVVGTDNESGGVINVNGLGSGINIAGTGSFLKVGNGSANYALEVDVGNNQVKAASGNIILDSNGALTTKYSGQTVFEVNPESNANPIPVLLFNGGINGTATFNGAGDNKVTLKNGAITATGAISGKTIMATDNLYIGTGTNQIDVAAAVAGSGVIAATGETGASGLVKGSTVYDYLNGAKLDLGAESTQIEIGQNSTASGNYAIAIGTDATTATTTASESSIAIGKSAEAKSGYTIAMGTNAKVASGTGTIAIGYNANASGNDTATAIGFGATSFQGTAIGWSANANGAGATALGGFANANSEYATAVGLSANATWQNTTAIGRGAEASRVYSQDPLIYSSTESATALGAYSKAQNDYATAVGANAQASGLNSVALGSNSVANRAAYVGTENYAYLGDTKTTPAWQSTHGAVSVGNDTPGSEVTRQITGVAAGTEDTDAVNVAQLKSATPVINSAHNYYVGTTTAGVKVTDAVDAVDKALGKVAENGNYIKVYNATTPMGTFAENLTALDTAIGKVTSTNYAVASTGTAATSLAKSIDNIDAGLGAKITADGNYIRKSDTNSINANIQALDVAAGTLRDKTQNITATAGTTKMEGVLNVVPTGETTGIAISGTAKTITGLSNTTTTAADFGTVGRAATEEQLKATTTSLTDGGLKFTANSGGTFTNKLSSTVGVIGGGSKADDKYSDSNVKTVIAQDTAGNSTITIKLDKNPTFTSLTTTGNISGASISASGMLSGASLKVNGVDVTTPLTTTGAVATGNAGYVTGGTVYGEVRPTADGNFVKTANKTADNLTALDTQVKTNADNITALQSSTTAAVGTLTEDGNYIKKSATNNVVQNLSALDTQVKKNTDDIATLQNSITVKEDASGVKTTTIEGNLVIKEENGTTKDVTAALSTDGEVAKQGDAGSEGYLKGETVYDYLNKGDNGKEVKLATESQQISMGKGSEATGAESIAIGNEVGTQKNQATGTQSIAIGFGNQVSGNHSGAIGDPTYIAADNSYAIGNSNNITATGTRSFAIGNNNTIGGSDTFVLGSNVNTNAANAVVLGNNSTGEANAVSVGSVGGERQIKHVAPGTDANDAATVGQLGALAQAADNGINRLDSKVNKVGAGAAALAALHPIDTDDKFTMGLGYGNYRNAHSAAIGLFYRPTEKVMISVGGTLGNGENMINAGISFALDKGKGFGTSKAMMARKIAAQEEKITQQDAKIQSLEEENAKLAARLAAIEEKLAK